MVSYIASAPMEGVTRSVFRAAHWAQFPGVDTYFTPFLAPTADEMFSEKEIREVRPAVNGGAPVSEKAMAPHSSTLAWKVPWAEEPNRLQSMGSLRVGHD